MSPFRSSEALLSCSRSQRNIFGSYPSEAELANSLTKYPLRTTVNQETGEATHVESSSFDIDEDGNESVDPDNVITPDYSDSDSDAIHDVLFCLQCMIMITQPSQVDHNHFHRSHEHPLATVP